MSQPHINRFATSRALATALSQKIAQTLVCAIDQDGAALMAVSGGSTPRQLFQILSAEQIDWAKVTVTLVDERFVPPSHERSNHRLVATYLLQNAAAHAKFLPLYSADTIPLEAARQAAAKMDALGKPLDVAILGMGTDGHTASWFPQSEQLGAVTDPNQSASIMAAFDPAQKEARLTMTQPFVQKTGAVVLHIEGQEKSHVLERALGDGPVAELPVRAILTKTQQPMQIYWAP